MGDTKTTYEGEMPLPLNSGKSMNPDVDYSKKKRVRYDHEKQV